MSHSKERQEKICLNCGTHLTDRYCQHCGQENIEPKETVWGLVSHFFNDITHFDGKFFSTVKYLITKPGFLSQEYIRGRRAGYLHPIRMYVFTSAFFFIIFFSLFNPEKMIKGGKDTEEELKELHDASISLKEKQANTTDTTLKSAIERAITHIDEHATILEQKAREEKADDSAKLALKNRITDSITAKLQRSKLMADSPKLHPDAVAGKEKFEEQYGKGTIKINGEKTEYRSQLAYDSVQKELPEVKKDGWFIGGIKRKAVFFQNKSKSDRKEAAALLMEKFMHNLPQALFISLPLFALVLLILYSRRKFYYVDHSIFSIHLYCANFILLLITSGFNRLVEVTGWKWLQVFIFIGWLANFFYLYKAMRRFYGQGRGKTILKFIILNFCSLIIITVLVSIFFFLSILQFK